MARRKLRRIEPRRARPQQLERRPSEMHDVETLPATIRRPTAELATAASPSKHGRPSPLPTSRRIKPRQLVLVLVRTVTGPNDRHRLLLCNSLHERRTNRQQRSTLETIPTADTHTELTQELEEGLDGLDHAYAVGDLTLSEYNERRESLAEWFETHEPAPDELRLTPHGISFCGEVADCPQRIGAFDGMPPPGVGGQSKTVSEGVQESALFFSPRCQNFRRGYRHGLQQRPGHSCLSARTSQLSRVCFAKRRDSRVRVSSPMSHPPWSEIGLNSELCTFALLSKLQTSNFAELLRTVSETAYLTNLP